MFTHSTLLLLLLLLVLLLLPPPLLLLPLASDVQLQYRSSISYSHHDKDLRQLQLGRVTFTVRDLFESGIRPYGTYHSCINHSFPLIRDPHLFEINTTARTPALEPDLVVGATYRQHCGTRVCAVASRTNANLFIASISFGFSSVFMNT